MKEQLQAPFAPKDIEWRIQRSGTTKNGGAWAMVLAYVTARAIQDRLDDVVGPENWKVSYDHEANGVMCNLSVKCGDEWVTKSDGSQETQVEAFKGGISGALKRAGVAWGIGRYLYRLDATFVSLTENKVDGWNRHYDKESKKTFYWKNPDLPTWALPKNGA